MTPQTPRPDMRHRLEGRPKWVTIAAVPFLLGAFFQAPAGLVGDLAAFGLIALGMWQTQQGLRAEAAYDIRASARRPALPRKLLGGLLAGMGLGLGAAEPGALTGAGLIGLAGVALHLLAFGADPLRDKGIDDAGDFQQERSRRMIAEGQSFLDQMKQAIRLSGDPALVARVALFEGTVHRLFARVSRDPRDLAAVRRYLGVYLMGARDATARFADLYASSRDGQARAAYEAFLTDLERDFTARSDKLLEGDRDELEVEMTVLRERLAREGVRPAADDTPRSDEAQTLDQLLTFPPDRAKTR
ncbi:5-bromo-4-chloroindolyl phosphate hydrolysis family protein [Paracoccus sp. (in: a-proteobacteria)]|uniref:5-bromo-4-chloroindolyl phosphate hydrolysis family protein n=1 Tax=Paracoccus sp. TaxID=267 RepID=UPI003A889ABB